MPIVTDDALESAELVQLERRYGAIRRDHFSISVGGRFLDKMGRKRQADRRAEVLSVLQRRDGKILLHTKSTYPPNTWRLPTGGIDLREPVVEALMREVHEETGLMVANERLLSILGYTFEGRNSSLPFTTFIFLVPDVEGEPVALDKSENISGFRWVDPVELDDTTEQLRSLPEDKPGRVDWGHFRSIAHIHVREMLT